VSTTSHSKAFSLLTLALCSAATVVSAAEDHPPELQPGVRLVPYDPTMFRPDPVYPEGSYNPDEALKIYGDKRYVPTTRPLIELGRELYREGPFQPGINVIGEKNLLLPGFLMSGDWRTAVAYNDTGNSSVGVLATRLNLDLDLRLTATERIHAFFRPFDDNGSFTRVEFDQRPAKRTLELDAVPEALFFEGDLGAITSGLTDTDSRFDLPFTFGLIPLLFQNGVWMEDAFTGFAFSIPARNSRWLDISTFDLTFFTGFDRVTSPAFRNAAAFDQDSVSVYGVAAFLEANQGYWEFGYAFLDGTDQQENADYSNFTVAFTRRYFDRISNSIRVIANVGQSPNASAAGRTANGVLLLIENSLVTSLPSTLVPYFNFFVGIEKPQSVARDAGAGGVLKNTGILFETDGLTGFPTLDDSANDTAGGAIGIQYLFDLDQQIVVEIAAVQVLGGVNDPSRIAPGNQYGVGARYQIPLNHSWILRADAMYGWRGEIADVAGVRVELRYKF